MAHANGAGSAHSHRPQIYSLSLPHSLEKEYTFATCKVGLPLGEVVNEHRHRCCRELKDLIDLTAFAISTQTPFIVNQVGKRLSDMTEME